MSKDGGGRRDSETVGIVRKSRSAKELFAFWREAFFRFSQTFCLGTLFLKVAPLRQGFRSVASVRSWGLENIFVKKKGPLQIRLGVGRAPARLSEGVPNKKIRRLT